MVLNSSHHSFPFELGLLEVDQHSKIHSRDRQITDHLGHMGFVECGNHFGIHNDLPIDDQVWNEQPYWPAFLVNIEPALLIHGQADSLKFENQGILVDFLIESRLQFVQHAHRRTDDLFTQFGMNHFLTTDFTD